MTKKKIPGNQCHSSTPCNTLKQYFAFNGNYSAVITAGTPQLVKLTLKLTQWWERGPLSKLLAMQAWGTVFLWKRWAWWAPCLSERSVSRNEVMGPQEGHLKFTLDLHMYHPQSRTPNLQSAFTYPDIFFFLQCWGSCSSLHMLGKCFTTSLHPQNLNYFQFLNVETKWRIKSNVSVTVLQPFLSIQDLTLFWLQLLPRHFNFLYLKKRSRKSPTQLFGAWNSRTLGTTSQHFPPFLYLPSLFSQSSNKIS